MIYTIGETVLDIIFKDMQPIGAKAGGSALNTAVSLGVLGNSVSFISELGDDEPSNFILEFLKNHSVNCSHIVTNHSRKTSLALAFLNEKNDAHYQFYKDLPEQYSHISIQFSEKDCLLFSSSFAISQRVRNQLCDYLDNARLHNSIVMYDPNIRKAIENNSIEQSFIFDNFTKASIVRASDDDLFNIFKTNIFSDVYTRLQQFGVSILIVTKNKNAVELFTPEFSATYAVDSIEPISTIGAGDTFNAGVLHCLHQEQVQADSLTQLSPVFWDKAISFAIACSAVVCMSLDNYIGTQDLLRLKNKL